MAIEGNLLTQPGIVLSVRAQTAVEADSLIRWDGSLPLASINGSRVMGVTLSSAAAGEFVSVAVSGIVQCQVEAGFANIGAGSLVFSQGSKAFLFNPAATDYENQFIVGKLVDPIGSTATVAGQLVRVFLTLEEGY